MHISEAVDTGTKFFIFGGYGTGKTYFSSTLPQPIYYFDCDLGIKTALNRLKAEGTLDDAEIDFDPFFEGPEVIQKKAGSFVQKSVIIPDSSKNEKLVVGGFVYRKLEAKLVEMIIDAEQEECKYKTVVLDSLSSFAKIMQDFIMSLKKDQSRDRGVANLNDMGILIRKFPDFINLFHKLGDYGIITVVTAHMQLKEDVRGIKSPDGKTDNLEYLGTFRLPSILGKDLPFSLGKWFDEVYFSYAERHGSESDYYFETQSKKDLFCKTRSSTMPAIVEQDWGVIKEYLHL
jgi:hypothetical protein